MRIKLYLNANHTATQTGSAAVEGALPRPPIHPGGGTLWRIISTQCLPGEAQKHDPSPCAKVAVETGQAHGYVLLKDRDGVAQYLLMPSAKITGIEDPLVLEPDAANYFARAWAEREVTPRKLGRPLDRTQLSVAVNSIYGRSQDQLHLHIDCVGKAVSATLKGLALPQDGAWTRVTLNRHAYRVRWLSENQLMSDNPFQLLVQGFPQARHEMGAWTRAFVGATSPSGQPGLALLADRVDPAHGDRASSEELQDHACGV